MKPLLSLKQHQSLALTPRLQQSLRLLQLSTVEFSLQMREALATNPFLEDASEADGTQEGSTILPVTPGLQSAAETSAPATPADDASPAADSFGADSAVDLPDADFGGERRGSQDRDDSSDWTNRAPATVTLRDHLRDQIQLSLLGDRDRMLAHLIIESLDDDGYLRQDLRELAALPACDPPVEEEELLASLRWVQSLDPPGVAARSIGECLALQLQSRPPDETRELALRIARARLPLIMTREFRKLQQLESCNEEQLSAAIGMLKKLDPRPGWRFGDSDVRYVVPDVIVRKVRNQWTVFPNAEVCPRIRLNRAYAAIFRRARSERSVQLAQQLQEARWLMRNAQQRISTIQRVAEAIVARQVKFLEYGDIAMKPLQLQQIADELGVHESTVSRVTSNKYMATPRGIFEFKRFFSRRLGTVSGGACAATAIRAALKELINGEDTHAPLSDARLADILLAQGVRVARRTVTKYRRLMQVPNVDLRRLS